MNRMWMMVIGFIVVVIILYIAISLTSAGQSGAMANLGTISGILGG